MAAATAASHERARDEASAALHASQARIAALEDTAAAAEATQRTEALQGQGLRDHVRSLEARAEGLEARCGYLQADLQRVCHRMRPCLPAQALAPLCSLRQAWCGDRRRGAVFAARAALPVAQTGGCVEVRRGARVRVRAGARRSNSRL